MSRFLAVWPVADDTMPLHELLDEARRDLPAVARRHGQRVLRHGSPALREGRSVPGSGGAALVVVIVAEVEPIRQAVAA
jgi:hypothetical protein